MNTNTHTIKSPNYKRVLSKAKTKALKARVKRSGLTYLQIAREAGRSYSLVAQVMTGVKMSPVVMAAIERLEARATIGGLK